MLDLVFPPAGFIRDACGCYFFCTDLSLTSRLSSHRTDGGVESLLASSHLGEASEIFLVGEQACPSEPHGPLLEATISWLPVACSGLKEE